MKEGMNEIQQQQQNNIKIFKKNKNKKKQRKIGMDDGKNGIA